MRPGMKLFIAFLMGVFLTLLLMPLLAEPKVAVEIYKNRESGEMTYCETGTLVDPPMQHMGSGTIRESKAESC